MSNVPILTEVVQETRWLVRLKYPGETHILDQLVYGPTKADAIGKALAKYPNLEWAPGVAEQAAACALDDGLDRMLKIVNGGNA